MRGAILGLAVLCTTPVAALSTPGVPSPRFFTLDRPDGRFGGEFLLSEVFLDSAESEFGGEAELHGRRLDLFIQAGFEQSGGGRHGGYLQIARTSVTAEVGGGEEDLTGSLGPELGYVYVHPFDKSGEVVLRVGLTATGSDDFESLLASALTSPARITDLALFYPDVGLLRVAISPRGQLGRFFYQADIGVDLPAWGDNAEDADALMRANGAVGVALDVVELGVELVNVINPSEGDLEDGALHTLTLGARFALGAFRPGVAFTLPLDDGFEEIPGILQISLGAQLDDVIK
jgi:hypothetical protein